MTGRTMHIVSTLPIAIVTVAFGYSPVIIVPLVIGVLSPELDSFDKAYHRSWLLHTFLAPALVYELVIRMDIGGLWLVTGIHFVTLGQLVHFVRDYIYPREMTHTGAEWPVRPPISSETWGLGLLGVVWAIQWFIYLVPAFIPWLVGL